MQQQYNKCADVFCVKLVKVHCRHGVGVGMVSPRRLKSVYKFVFAASMIAPQHNADSNSMHQELQKCMALTHKHKKKTNASMDQAFFFFFNLGQV